MAERQLDAVGADGSRTPVFVRIGAPVPDPLPGGYCFCPHRIDGLGDDAVGGAFGVDSLRLTVDPASYVALRPGG
ncbi:DUF6968 family protein [Blastococcus capsensis]|uniref:DUF6968 family protein n=1 Tax=Blastococcus capsensis TaxID=1564163 RepID=UPI002541167F|nr:hypothetical protein [Blastococcus capsensis]MDK3256428.1 hypothetical protein [Blastococcus capsensis]